MKTVAFIPIKLNNERLPGKNIKLLDGKPLCSYLFETLLRAENIDERYVYCSDDSFREYVPKGIEFIKRDKRLNGPEISGTDVITAFIDEVQADNYLLAHVTTPFLTKETIEKVVEQIKCNGKEAAMAARSLKEFAWYEGKPINYVPTHAVPRTQDLLPIYVESILYAFRRTTFEKYKSRTGLHPVIVEIGKTEAHDIDYQEDFDLAEALLLLKKQRKLNG